MSEQRRVYEIAKTGPTGDNYSLFYREHDASVSYPVSVPGRYDSEQAARTEAYRLYLGLEYCAKCKRLHQPEDLEAGLCCKCSSPGTKGKKATPPPAS
jgi:hypothetical protein